MARGITETDVLEAADAVLARGERPTIERVRQELGRGSPNTVNRHLETWWVSLTRRMQGSAAGDSSLPAALLELCDRLYTGLREQVQAEAQAVLAAGQGTLQVREAELAAQAQNLAAEKTAMAVAAQQLGTELDTLRARNEALLSERAQLQAVVLQLQRIAKDAEAAAAAARDSTEAAQAAHRSEVQKIRSQWEGNETRWLREIEHLRDETKRHRTEHNLAVKQLREQIKSAEGRLAASLKDRQRIAADLVREREARIAAEAAVRATDALVKTLTPTPRTRAQSGKSNVRSRRTAGTSRSVA